MTYDESESPEPWDTFAGGGIVLDRGPTSPGSSNQGSEPQLSIEDFVLSGQMSSTGTAVQATPLMSDQFTTDALASEVAAISIADLEWEARPSAHPGELVLGNLLSGYELTLLEIGGSQAYAWMLEAVDPQMRRDISIQTTSASLSYLFKDCLPTRFQPGPLKSDERRSLPSALLTVRCTELDMSGTTNRKQTHRWISRAIDSEVPRSQQLRDVEIQQQNGDGESATTFMASRAFPIRYVFPRFDTIQPQPLTESLTLKVNELTILTR